MNRYYIHREGNPKGLESRQGGGPANYLTRMTIQFFIPYSIEFK